MHKTTASKGELTKEQEQTLEAGMFVRDFARESSGTISQKQRLSIGTDMLNVASGLRMAAHARRTRSSNVYLSLLANWAEVCEIRRLFQRDPE